MIDDPELLGSSLPAPAGPAALPEQQATWTDDDAVEDDDDDDPARTQGITPFGRTASYVHSTPEPVAGALPRRIRRRADFARCLAKLLDELPPGTLLTTKGATLFAETAADSCGTTVAGVFKLEFKSETVAKIDAGTAYFARPVTAAMLDKAHKHERVYCGSELLIARTWPWDPADVARSAVFLVLSAPPHPADGIAFNFTDVDRRRITTLTTLIGLREESYEQKRAEQLLRKGTKVMAATSRVEKRLADLASAISEAAGAEHVAIWLASQGNTDTFRLRAVAGGPSPEDQAEHLTASPSMHRDMLRLAQGRPVAVATSALQWLPRVFDVAPERLGDSALVIPVRRAGDLIGVAAGVSSVENAESIADVGQESIVGLLEALADQVALATEFAHSARDAQQNARRFALLAAIAEIALAKLGATEMVDAILTRVREHFDSHKASLFLLHGDRGSLGTRSVQRQDQTTSRMHTARVAVSWDDQLIGSLVLRRADTPFDSTDEETLVQVADQIALALSASGRFEFEASMAVLDMLTDLPNRRSAEKTLDNELGHVSRDSDAYLIICLLDIDHFKHINDTFGHENGDMVLRQIATMFKAQLRGSDYVARWGGEEFLLLYRTGDLARSRQVAERVRRAVGMISPKTTNGEKIDVTMSLGGAICPVNGTTRDVLLLAADAALYRAKAAGRDQAAWAPDPDDARRDTPAIAGR